MSALEAAADPSTRVHRGTTNRNARGGSDDRRRRREWLVETYRADVDVLIVPWLRRTIEVPLGEGSPACRCYRCGTLLTVDTVSPDRIKPGIEGGTYRRENIRPACELCQCRTGQALAMKRTRAKKARKQARS